MRTTYLFIDGGYLNKIHADAMTSVFGMSGDIDLGNVPITLRNMTADMDITRSFYYDCIDEVRKATEDDSQLKVRIECQNHSINAINSLPGFFVRLGSVTGRAGRIRQKEVDVLLAVDMLEHSFRKNMEVAVLLAGDRDFVPIVESLVRLGTYVYVVYEPQSASPELHRSADVGIRLTFDHLWSWTTASFRASRQLPQESSQSGCPDLFPRTVTKRGEVDGAEVYLWSHNGSLYTLVFVGGNEARLYHHADKNLLMRYAAAKHGEIIWK